MNRSVLLVIASMLISLGLACGDDHRVSRIPNVSPVAVLSVPIVAEAGEQVLFDASDSSDEDGQIVEYRFSPGIGSAVIITAEPAILYTYESPGDYVVRLTVVDDLEGKNAVASTISVLTP